MPENILFIGREKLVQRLTADRKDYFILGARRIGKTMLLKHLENTLLDDNIPAIYLSIEGDQSSEKVKRRIQYGLRRNKISLQVPNFADLNLFEFLSELSLEVETTGHEKLVLLMDEAEQLTEIEKEENGFVRNFKNRIQTTKHLQFILTASPRINSLFEEIAGQSDFLESFEVDILPVLEKEDAQVLVKRLSEGKKISAEAVRQILNYTHYQPYLISIFIKRLINKEKINSPDEITAHETYTRNLLRHIFVTYFGGISEKRRNIIFSIFKNEYTYSKKDLVDLMELIHYGYLKTKDNQYLVSNWFFYLWLETHEHKSSPDPNKNEAQQTNGVPGEIASEVIKYIEEDQPDLAIQFLSNLFRSQDDRDRQAQVLLLTAQLNRINKQFNQGTIDNKEYGLQKQKINHAILTLIL